MVSQKEGWSAYLGLRTGAKVDGLVAAREGNIKPAEESVNVYFVSLRSPRSRGTNPDRVSPQLTVITSRLELERHFESQILLLDGRNVDMSDRARLGDDRAELDAVDEGFAQGDIFDTGVVETVHVVPVYDVSLNALRAGKIDRL